MALNTYGKYQRKTVKVADYQEWLKASPEPSCLGSHNPAFLTVEKSTPIEQAAALKKCAECPLLQGCNFFATSKLFRANDAVIGGQIFRNGTPSERVFTVKNGEIHLLPEYTLQASAA